MARPHYRNVPLLGGDVAQFRRKIQAAHSSFQNWGVFGTSRWTAPIGSGSNFIPPLNRMLFEKFGMPAATPWSDFAWSGNTTFINTGAGNDSGSILSNSHKLPGLDGRVTNATSLGPLQTYAYGGVNDSEVGKGYRYFDPTTGTIVWDVIVQKSTTGPTDLRITEKTGTVPRSFTGTTQQQDISSGLLLDADDTTLVLRTTPPLTYSASEPLWNIYIQGWDGAAVQTGLQAICSRLRDTARQNGVAMTPLSEGGYRPSSVLANHANAGAMLNLMGPWDVLYIAMGANDTDVDQFKTDTQALMTALRGSSWVNDANQFIVLISDPPRFDLNSTQEADYNQQAAVLLELANENGNTGFMNLAREFSPLDSSFFTDQVHFTEDGSVSMASAFGRLLDKA